jgi:5-formyltetrahydrofolate cyclo-ligase
VTEDVAAWRRERRAELIARRAAIGEAARTAWSAALERHLLTLLRGLEPGALGIYWPVRGEFDARPAVGMLLGEGWRAALPVIETANAPMAFRGWTPDAEMVAGRYGIPVPLGGPPLVPTVLLAPLVGFDDAKFRLGYGGGYFDRTLAALTPRPVAVGVGFELGRLPSVRPQPYDLPMDRIVTEAGAR